MSFPRYERYKDSGVEWFGEVPEHWQVKRLRFAALVNPSRSETNCLDKSLPVSFVPMEAISEIGPPAITDVRTLADVETGYTYFRDADIAIAKITPCFENGKRAHFLHLVNGIGFGTTELHVLRARPREADARFLFWVSASSQFMGFGAGSMYGTGGQQRVPEDFIKNYFIAIPAPTEQQVIATFLDKETAKIDVLIEEQRRLIELLKEKRQSSISHAVTKGLNSNTQMMESGIEWIGRIPSHWRIVRLRLIADVRGGVAKGRNLGKAETIHVPYLRVANVQSGYLDLEDVTEIEIEPHELERYRLLPGDVLMNEGGDFDKLGRGAIWRAQIEDCIHQNHVFSVRLHDVEPEWLTLVSSSECGRFYFMTRSKQSTNLASISSSNLRELPVPLPPENERRTIIEKITAYIKAVDALIEDTGSALDLLQKRRTALISAAVTGKIDVRAYMAKPAMSATQYNSGFAHQLLAAEILDRCNSQRMGRIKLQKLIHLCEYHGQVSEVQGDYSRKAAGPFDARAMAGISKNLKKQKWFEEVKEGERYVYRPLEKRGEHKKYLAHWQAEMPRIDEVLSLLGNFKTRECEIVSTLYAAWNDLLIDGGTTDDAAILHEASSAERWHKSKEQIAPERWKKALQWMKDKGLVPVGYGKHTRHTAGKIGIATEVAHEPA